MIQTPIYYSMIYINKMEYLPTNVINLIVRFSSYPIADLLKPNISYDDTSEVYFFTKITCGNKIFKSYEDNDCISEIVEQTVIKNIVKHTLNINYIKSRHLSSLNPLYLHFNREKINYIILYDCNDYISDDDGRYVGYIEDEYNNDIIDFENDDEYI